MRIFDRYVAALFIRNYLLSFLVLIGLFVVLDMVFKFDELVEVADKGPGAVSHVLLGIADYYFHQSFLFFAHLCGIIPVVAAAFTLMRLSRFNELSAMLSAGVPLLRLAMPIIVAGLVLNGLLIIDQELLIPRMIEKLTRSADQINRGEEVCFSISGMQDDSGAVLVASRYFPNASPPRIENLSIIECDDHYRPVAHIRAEQAQWDRRQNAWRLTDGQRLTIGEGGGAKPAELYRGSFTPEEIQLWRSGDYVMLLSTARINQLLERPGSYGRAGLLRIKHARRAQPLVNIILLLLAIASVLTRQREELKMAATKCLLLCGACLALTFISYHMAKTDTLLAGPRLADLWPALMAFLPVFIFGPLSVWMLDRVRT